MQYNTHTLIHSGRPNLQAYIQEGSVHIISKVTFDLL